MSPICCPSATGRSSRRESRAMTSRSDAAASGQVRSCSGTDPRRVGALLDSVNAVANRLAGRRSGLVLSGGR